MVDGKVQYRMMGEGDLPITEMLDALASIGYEGYVSLEWVKRWAPDLTDPGIVFPQFAHYMHSYFETRLLQDNIAHTGKYIWKKEHLIDLTFPEVLDRVADRVPGAERLPTIPRWTTRAPIPSSATMWTPSPAR